MRRHLEHQKLVVVFFYNWIFFWQRAISRCRCQQATFEMWSWYISFELLSVVKDDFLTEPSNVPEANRRQSLSGSWVAYRSRFVFLFLFFDFVFMFFVFFCEYFSYKFVLFGGRRRVCWHHIVRFSVRFFFRFVVFVLGFSGVWTPCDVRKGQRAAGPCCCGEEWRPASFRRVDRRNKRENGNGREKGREKGR